MFPLLESAIAFVVIMLAASLMVTALVRILHQVTRRRKRGVPEMLRRLMVGFRDERGLIAEPGLEAAYVDAFVHDIVASPILHTGRSHDRAVCGRAERHAIEYLDRGDLLRLVRRHGGPERPLPARWHGLPASEKPPLVRDLAEYIEDWFETVEGTVAQEFAEDARRHTVVLSCLVVVLLNFDALRIAESLYSDHALARDLAGQVGELQETADRLGVEPAPDDVDPAAEAAWRETFREVKKTAAVMTDYRLPIGWQGSYMTRRWCAYQGACDDPAMAVPTRGELLRDALLWLAGLLVSCVLLSLGAPYWVETLKRLVNLRNAVQARKEPSDGKNPRRRRDDGHDGRAERDGDHERDPAPDGGAR